MNQTTPATKNKSKGEQTVSQLITPEEIKISVREHYADLARKSQSCCGPSDCDCNSLYPQDLAAQVPADIANFSL